MVTSDGRTLTDAEIERVADALGATKQYAVDLWKNDEAKKQVISLAERMVRDGGNFFSLDAWQHLSQLHVYAQPRRLSVPASALENMQMVIHRIGECIFRVKSHVEGRGKMEEWRLFSVMVYLAVVHETSTPEMATFAATLWEILIVCCEVPVVPQPQ